MKPKDKIRVKILRYKIKQMLKRRGLWDKLDHFWINAAKQSGS